MHRRRVVMVGVWMTGHGVVSARTLDGGGQTEEDQHEMTLPSDHDPAFSFSASAEAQSKDEADATRNADEYTSRCSLDAWCTTMHLRSPSSACGVRTG